MTSLATPEPAADPTDSALQEELDRANLVSEFADALAAEVGRDGSASPRARALAAATRSACASLENQRRYRRQIENATRLLDGGPA